MDGDDVRGQGADEPLDRGRAGARSRWLDDGIKRGSGQRPEALIDVVNGNGDQLPQKRRFNLPWGQIVVFPSVPLRIVPDAIDWRDGIAIWRLQMETICG